MDRQWKFNRDRLIAFREARGISQEKLAEVIGTSKQHVSRWEIGDLIPSTATIVKICNAFDLSPAYFFTETV